MQDKLLQDFLKKYHEFKGKICDNEDEWFLRNAVLVEDIKKILDKRFDRKDIFKEYEQRVKDAIDILKSLKEQNDTDNPQDQQRKSAISDCITILNRELKIKESEKEK